MSVIIKCKSCDGTGYVPMGNGVRGLLVCKACNGVGTYENDEITIINDETFYKIPNGTNYNYTSIPKEFKPYFERLQQERDLYKEVNDKAIKCIDYSTKYRNSADIYQFVDIESEILEPLKFILELNEKNGNAYLKEFNDWLKEVE